MSTTPPPPPAAADGTAGGPSPLQVGMRFVKQYYNTISTSPDQIVRFYEPTLSTLSVGRSNCDSTQVRHEAAATRFSGAFLDSDDAATSSAATNMDIRFEFERGAIDAQASVNNAILVVATGSVVLNPHENGSSTKELQKTFVHTFFLGSTTVGTKRSYYIHNDILRFLEEPELSMNDAKMNEVTADTTGIEKEMPVEKVPVTKVSASVAAADAETMEETIQLEEPPPVVRTTTTTKDQVKPAATAKTTNSTPTAPQVVAKTAVPSVVTTTNEDAPGRGVEETKEAILADEETTPRSRTVAPAAKPNWASVARAQTAAPTPPATPARSVVTDKADNTSSNSHKPSGTPKSIGAGAEPTSPTAAAAGSTSPSPAAAAPTPFSKPQGKGGGGASRLVGKQRDPDCTLVIKNIDPDTVESEIRALFEPFATVTQSKVVGCTVSSNRGIAFVDYDSSEPVVKAIDQQLLAAFYVRERKLDIYQKTAEQRPRSNVRGGGRGDGPNQTSKSGSGGRGRDFRRKNSGGGGGRGDRGGGGGGRSGRDGGGRGRSGRDGGGGR